MSFYLVLLFLVACFSACISYTKKGYLTYAFKILVLSLLIIPAAIRYGIGTDYYSYLYVYQLIARNGANYIEAGYWWLNRFVYLCGGNAQIVLAISAFFTVFFTFKGLDYKRWHIYSILFILIIYAWYFTTVRQILSASIAFYALRLIEEEGKRTKALILIVFAFLFHASSIMYPIFYIIGRRVSITKKVALCIYFVAFVFTFILSSYLTQYMSILVALTSYGSYTESDWFMAGNAGSGMANLTRYVMFLFLLIFYPLEKENSSNRLIYNILLVYVIFEIMSAQIVILNRISRGLIFVLLPVIWDITRTKRRYYIYVNICVYFLIIAYFLASLVNRIPNLFPYKTCF